MFVDFLQPLAGNRLPVLADNILHDVKHVKYRVYLLGFVGDVELDQLLETGWFGLAGEERKFLMLGELELRVQRVLDVQLSFVLGRNVVDHTVYLLVELLGEVLFDEVLGRGLGLHIDNFIVYLM